MAEGKSTSKRRIRSSESVRDKAKKSAVKALKPSRKNALATKVKKPIHAANELRKKEYYLPLPDNKLGRFLNKRRRIIPSYFRNSYKELKDVKWPNRKETTQLTIAVFIFAIIFGVLIAVTDYGLDKIFKELLLK